MSVGTLGQGLAQRRAGDEAEHLRRLGGELPVGMIGRMHPGGDAATGEQVVPGGAELAGVCLGSLVVPYARDGGRSLDCPGRVAGGGQPQDQGALAGSVVIQG